MSSENNEAKFDPLEPSMSIFQASTVVDSLLDKVVHMKYMEEIEAKVPQFTILSTTFLALKLVESLEIKYDSKADDEFLTHSQQEADEEEPPNIGENDPHLPFAKINYKPPEPIKLKKDITDRLSVTDIDTVLRKKASTKMNTQAINRVTSNISITEGTFGHRKESLGKTDEQSLHIKEMSDSRRNFNKKKDKQKMPSY